MELQSNFCQCANAKVENGSVALDALERVRTHCPALQYVFLPDDTWLEFKVWHERTDTAAAHRSMLLLALERGHLSRLTGAIHRYLIKNGAMRPTVRRQYVKDLRERWMLYPDPLERHRKARMFSGRVAELQCAEWLETMGWMVEGLEALRPGHDIEARTGESGVTAFEVKSIGRDDDAFGLILRSMAQEPAVASFSPYAAINYLLFRVYEAAKQLGEFDGHRLALVVIDNCAWWRFERQLQSHWIDLANPRFFEHDEEWETFIKEQEGRYPALRDELRYVVRAIDGVWIIRRAYAYEYHLDHELRT